MAQWVNSTWWDAAALGYGPESLIPDRAMHFVRHETLKTPQLRVASPLNIICLNYITCPCLNQLLARELEPAYAEAHILKMMVSIPSPHLLSWNTHAKHGATLRSWKLPGGYDPYVLVNHAAFFLSYIFFLNAMLILYRVTPITSCECGYLSKPKTPAPVGKMHRKRIPILVSSNNVCVKWLTLRWKE